MQQAERQALELSVALKQKSAELAVKKLAELEKSCSGCHTEYRN